MAAGFDEKKEAEKIEAETRCRTLIGVLNASINSHVSKSVGNDEALIRKLIAIKIERMISSGEVTESLVTNFMVDIAYLCPK